MDLIDVPAQLLLRQVRSALGAGDSADAERAAFWLLQAEALGLRGFGLDMLLRELERLGTDRAGTARATDAARAAVAPAPPAPISSLDASGVPGPLALAAAVRRASEAADAQGIGLVGVRGAGALGVLGLAARSLALEGRVAVVAAQAPAMVAPWGGRAPAIGTNPLAFSAPRSGDAPLVADFATSGITLAELRERRSSGERLPQGVALDAAGEPTEDPADVAALLAAGRLGSLVGLFVEVLAGAATGGRTRADAPADAAAHGRGAIVIAIDPERSGGALVADSCARIAADWVAAGGHVPGRFDRLPAEPGSLPETIAVSARSYDALRRGAPGAPA